MTDYDRGAYTPQTDAPLAFDPRRPSERRPMPMALIGSGVVLAVLLAGVAMVYRGGVRHAGESPRPVGEPVMAVKTAPPPSAQTAANAPSSMDVYNAGEGNTVSPAANTVAAAPAPTFAAPAEQPAARPAPSAATVAMLSKPSAPSHIERRPTPAESAAAPGAPAPAKLAAAPARKPPAAVAKAEANPDAGVTATAKSDARIKTASLTPPHHPVLHSNLDESELAAAGATRTEAGEADADASTPAKPAAHKAKAAKSADPIGALVTSSTAAAAAPAGKSVVQIGAFSSTALADKGYADVSAALPGRMGGKAKHVQSLDKDGTTLYRTWLSGFATRADAQAFCEALKAKGKTCLVKG